jgi:hypothetical protein
MLKIKNQVYSLNFLTLYTQLNYLVIKIMSYLFKAFSITVFINSSFGIYGRVI